MSIILRPQKVCLECKNVWYPDDDDAASHCPACGSADITNEKFNLSITILFYVTGLIVLGLIIISWEESELPPAVEPLSEVTESLTRSEEQVLLPPLEEEDAAAVPALETAPPLPPEIKEAPPTEVIPMPSDSSADPTSSQPAETIVVPVQPVPVEELLPKSNISKNEIAFSLWSNSELRLRRTYTNLMNDGSLQSELRKKEYLLFVDSKARKCGPLDPQFEMNINDIDKIKFKEEDANILECHGGENTKEYSRLSD